MHLINALNVRDALPDAVWYLLKYGVTEHTRLGDALVSPGPVTIQYSNPKEHVLINNVRDANPFFHLMEAMWMLAGRQDAAFLDNYIKDFSIRYANNGIVMDAYGYRWRLALHFDQIAEIIAQLRKDPGTRQAVLQMWGAGVNDLMSASAKPCNLVANFRVVDGKLDMTVFNRSNDLIWGCCGANAVHFPILQEYVAGKLGIPVRRYWQVSTNLHLYMDHVDMMLKRTNGACDLGTCLKDTYAYEATQPLMTDPLSFDDDLLDVMFWLDQLHQGKETTPGRIMNGFLREVVVPMATAHWRYKHGDQFGAFNAIGAVIAEDWRRAGREWIERRLASKARHEASRSA